MSDDSGDLRGRWAAVRFGLLGVTAVCILIAYFDSDGSGAVRDTTAIIGTLAISAAALWDAYFQRRRTQRVKAGLEESRIVDPMDLFMPVFGMAVLSGIVAASLSEAGALRWVLLAVCLLAAAFSYGSYRRYKMFGRRDREPR